MGPHGAERRHSHEVSYYFASIIVVAPSSYLGLEHQLFFLYAWYCLFIVLILWFIFYCPYCVLINSIIIIYNIDITREKEMNLSDWTKTYDIKH